MAFRITYHFNPPKPPETDDRVGVIDTLDQARAYALGRAERQLTDAVMVEIVGPPATRESWVFKNSGWEPATDA